MQVSFLRPVGHDLFGDEWHFYRGCVSDIDIVIQNSSKITDIK